MWLPIAIATITAVLPLFAAEHSIRTIDFKNAVYAWDEPGDRVPSDWQWLVKTSQASIQLKNGQYRFSDGRGKPDEFGPSLELLSVT